MKITADSIINFLDSEHIDWDILRSVFTRKDENLSPFCDEISHKIIQGQSILLNKFKLPNSQSNSAKNGYQHRFSGGTHFQIINIKNIEKIIAYLYRENIYNIDSVYSTNEINVYAVHNKNLNVRLHNKYKIHTDIPKI